MRVMEWAYVDRFGERAWRRWRWIAFVVFLGSSMYTWLRVAFVADTFERVGRTSAFIVSGRGIRVGGTGDRPVLVAKYAKAAVRVVPNSFPAGDRELAAVEADLPDVVRISTFDGSSSKGRIYAFPDANGRISCFGFYRGSPLAFASTDDPSCDATFSVIVHSTDESQLAEELHPVFLLSGATCLAFVGTLLWGPYGFRVRRR